MRTINELYLPLGLCSPEVQDELDSYRETPYLEVYTGLGWEIRQPNTRLLNRETYRVIIKEKVKIPLDVEGWHKVSRVFSNGWWRSVSFNDRYISLYQERDDFRPDQLMNERAVDALGNPIDLFTYENEEL